MYYNNSQEIQQQKESAQKKKKKKFGWAGSKKAHWQQHFVKRNIKEQNLKPTAGLKQDKQWKEKLKKPGDLFS